MLLASHSQNKRYTMLLMYTRENRLHTCHLFTPNMCKYIIRKYRIPNDLINFTMYKGDCNMLQPSLTTPKTIQDVWAMSMYILLINAHVFIPHLLKHGISWGTYSYKMYGRQMEDVPLLWVTHYFVQKKSSGSTSSFYSTLKGYSEIIAVTMTSIFIKFEIFAFW